MTTRSKAHERKPDKYLRWRFKLNGGAEGTALEPFVGRSWRLRNKTCRTQGANPYYQKAAANTATTAAIAKIVIFELIPES
jgi:hypothetical protein